jgi:two-component system, NtrC family, response regulator PilR
VRRDVLVVEDEPDLVATYERLLRRQGCRVVSAGSLVAALAAVERERPQLLITDLKLPDGDGLDVVRAVRARPAPPAVIVVTGYGNGASQDAALAAGATAFLTKPFSTAAFSKLVSSILAALPC